MIFFIKIFENVISYQGDIIYRKIYILATKETLYTAYYIPQDIYMPSCGKK